MEQMLDPAAPQSAPSREGGWHAQLPDDKAMLRAARDLVKDLGEAKPIEPIWRWIDQQHRYGIWFELVRESALVAESKLISDFGIYGFRAVGRQIADASGRTSRFTLSFEYEDVKEAESNWNRLRDFTISSAQILDRMG